MRTATTIDGGSGLQPIFPRFSLPRRRSQRRRLERAARGCRDVKLARRYRIVALRSKGWSYGDISEATGAGRATVRRVLRRWGLLGEAGLIDRREDNGNPKIDGRFLRHLTGILEGSPSDFGYPRPTWTRELMIRVLAERLAVRVSPATMSRALRQVGARRGRPKPAVKCPWSPVARKRRIHAFKRIIETLPSSQKALWVDEVDVHLNPKIGWDWMLPGHQRTVWTPGQNQKRYVAGALDAKTRRLVVVLGERKNSELFMVLILALIQEYPTARRIHLFLDNYVIHRSKQVQRLVESLGGAVELHFLPPYCPDDNPIERIWQDFHANVTRNHQHRQMWRLVAASLTCFAAYNARVEKAQRLPRKIVA